MDVNPRVLKEYLDYFLPREIVGPVLVVFSLEGVVDGIFNLYVPDEYATIGWGIVFLLSIATIAYWGTTDEEAMEELHDRIEEIEEIEERDDDDHDSI